jgi:hypothetical protein
MGISRQPRNAANRVAGQLPQNGSVQMQSQQPTGTMRRGFINPANRANASVGSQLPSAGNAPGTQISRQPANAATRANATNGIQIPPDAVFKSNTATRLNATTGSQLQPGGNAPVPQYYNPGNGANSQRQTAEIAPAGQFQQNRRIQGSDRWEGSSYQTFRNYRSEWHDRDWWRSHYSRIVFVAGGWYYWNEGYWFPAWGYDPEAHYTYDGPIYACNNLPPDQVVANAQAALQPQGYYQAEADGLLGPHTRSAIVNYQRDHGLYTTSTIDRPTSQSLGMR